MNALRRRSLSLCIAALALFTPLLTSCAHSQPPAAKAPAEAHAPAAAAKPIKICAWNLEHFVDPFDDKFVENEIENAGGQKNDEDLKALAQGIKSIDADVFVFSEVEGDRAVKLFLDNFVPDHGYKFFASAPSLQWYQNVVIASRHPITWFSTLREQEMYNEKLDRTENKYNSRIMFAEIRPTPSYSFVVAGLHLKAGGAPEDPVWREKQIGIVQSFLDREVKIDPKRNIVLAGDFNLVPSSPEYQSIFADKNLDLVDLFAPLNHPPTHPSDNPTRHIDYIIMSKEMARELVPDSVAVAKPLETAELRRATDHLPVVASIYPQDK